MEKVGMLRVLCLCDQIKFKVPELVDGEVSQAEALEKQAEHEGGEDW